jgi:MFS family permease
MIPGMAQLPFFYGWVVVAVAFVTMGLGVNARTAFSLFFSPMLDEFGWERGVTAGAFSLGFIVSTGFAPLLGRVMDRRGPRTVMVVGIVATTTGLALATLTTQPWHLAVTLGVLVIGGSWWIGYTGHALFLPYWFVRRRGLAIGIAFSGVGVGSIVMLPALQHLIEVAGWRAACLALAVTMVAMSLPLNLFLQRGRPEDLGLAADGDPTVARASTAARASNVVDPVWVATEWTLARAIRTARFWWVIVAFFGALYAWYAVQVHQTRYLRDIGFTQDVAAYALGLVGLAGVPGQIGLGYLSDRVGREWGWSLGCAGFALCYALLLAMQEYPTPALLYLMVLAQGGLGYGLAAVFGAIPAELFQGKHYGTIFGVLSLASGLGSGVGPWATGVVHDLTGSYTIAFWMGMISIAISAAAIWLAAPRKVRAVAGRIAQIPATAS